MSTVIRFLMSLSALFLLGVTPRGVMAQDRVDLLEVPGNSFALNRTDGVDYVYINISDTAIGSQSGATHRQSLRVAHEFPGVDSLTYRLYEPDKVTRKTDGVTLDQKNYLFTRILLPSPPSPYNTFSAYGVVTGCKGKGQVKNTNQLKYNFGCSNGNDVLDQLAVPAGLRPVIFGLFGSKLAFKNTGTIP